MEREEKRNRNTQAALVVALLATFGVMAFCASKAGNLTRTPSRAELLEQHNPGMSCYNPHKLGFPLDELAQMLGLEPSALETMCTYTPLKELQAKGLMQLFPGDDCVCNPESTAKENTETDCRPRPRTPIMIETRLNSTGNRSCIEFDHERTFIVPNKNGCLPEQSLSKISHRLLEKWKGAIYRAEHFFGGAILNLAGRTLENPYSVSPESRQRVLGVSLPINPEDQPQLPQRPTRRSQVNLERHNGDNKRLIA